MGNQATHLEALRRQSPSSVLYTHNVEIHPGLKMSKDDFVMTVEGIYSRACLRQSQEGVAIANSIRRMKEGAKVGKVVTFFFSKIDFRTYILVKRKRKERWGWGLGYYYS